MLLVSSKEAGYMIIKPELLHKGDVIGIVSPSHVASVEEYEEIMSRIENMGFHAKAGKTSTKIPMAT